MTPSQAVRFGYSLLALVSLWAAVYGAWRAYRVSALVEKLETLRDRAHDAEASRISGEARSLEALLDTAIRQAGTLNLSRLMLTRAAARFKLLENPLLVPHADPRLFPIRESLDLVVSRHVAAGCPLLWLWLPLAPRAASRLPGISALEIVLARR